MGSAFAAEPSAWFGEAPDRLLFAMSDSRLVAHAASETCAEECPHDTTDCGYFAWKGEGR